MLNWIDEQVGKHHYTDLLREAAHARLVEEARHEQPAIYKFYSPAVVQVGRWLVAVGCALQVRYGTIVESPASAATTETAIGCGSSQ